MLKKIKKYINIAALSMANVEKSSLTQTGLEFYNGVDQSQSQHQGKLMNSMIKGEVTAEVENLRWRMYKVLNETDKMTTKIIGYDSKGNPILERSVKDRCKDLENYVIDKLDDYPLKMVVLNNVIPDESFVTLNNFNNSDDSISYIEKQVDKQTRPIEVSRKISTRFPIENYTKKLVVRTIEEDKFLLEFYVSKYVDEDNRTSRLFLSALEKTIKKPYLSDMLELDTVEYITDKTIGVDNFLKFKYNNIVFDKIIEFDGNYVIKFFASTEINGTSLTTKFVVDELDELYRTKAKKNG